MQNNVQNPSMATSYVMFAVVADILGIRGDWDNTARTATFSDGVTTVVVTPGGRTALVNGVSRPITSSGLQADSRIIDGRFYVPIGFFRELNFNVDVEWLGGTPPNRQVRVAPR